MIEKVQIQYREKLQKILRIQRKVKRKYREKRKNIEKHRQNIQK